MAKLTHLGEKPCLVLGRAGMDLYADPPGTPIEQAVRFTAALGGSSANIAVAITRAGGRAALLTCVSDDAVGRFCRAQLDAYGVDTAHVGTVGGEARNSLAVVETRLENCQSVIYRNQAADFAMTTAHVQSVDYTRFSALIATGTALAAEPSCSATFAAFNLARAAGLPVIFDIDYRPYSWHSAEQAQQTYTRAAALCDVIVGNDVEFGFMAGDFDRGLDMARSLSEGGAQVVVYKMGERGAITFTASGKLRTGIYRTNALKPTGAGDAFLGNFIASLSRSQITDDNICDAVGEAVLHGSAAAAMVVARIGCAPAMPTTAELNQFITLHSGPTLG
jgi:5-dehydro-2-deoxygluconokinase